MASAWQVFRRTFWKAKSVYWQWWLMILGAGVFGGIFGGVGGIARGPVLAAILGGIGGLLAATFFMGAMFDTAALAAKGLPHVNVWRKGWRRWGKTLGYFLAAVIWMLGLLIVVGIVGAILAVAHVVTNFGAAGPAGPNIAQTLATGWPIMLLGSLVGLAASPFLTALQGGVFVGGRSVARAIGEAFRTGYSRQGYGLYVLLSLAVDLLMWAGLGLMVLSPTFGVLLLTVILEPLAVWVMIVFSAAIWLSVHPDPPAVDAPAAMATAQ